MLVSKIRLKQGFWKVIVVVMVVYSLFLYHEYKFNGIIQYPFTDFSKGNSAWFNLLGIGCGAILFYLIIAHFDSKLKNQQD